jgi:dienelactone hydrolase
VRLVSVLVALLVGSLPAQTPDFSAPGPYGSAYRTEDIQGTTELMPGSRIYYPDSGGAFPVSAVPAPIVAFGHGWQMGIDRYYSYGAHLASWGYVVVLPTISNPLINPEHDKRARLMIDAAMFVSALDTVTADHLFGRLDRWNWGFAGHSMGGAISLLAADTFGMPDTLRAVVALASPQTTPETHSAHLAVPKMLLTGSIDNIAPWSGVRSAFWADAPAPGAFAVIRGANHGYYMDFSYFWENGGTATITRATQQMICRRHMTAYFERHVHGDSSEWNFAYAYGDSLLGHPSMESVEVRLYPTAIEEPFVQLFGQLTGSPNPVRGQTRIGYGLAHTGNVTLAAYNPEGRLVRTLVRGTRPVGIHNVVWNGTDDAGRVLPQGEYFLCLSGSGLNVTRRLILLR